MMGPKTMMSATAVVAMAACGGTGNGGTTLEDQLRADVRSSVADYVEVMTFSPTAFDAMPTTGSATFNGKASMTIQQSGGADEINILGDSQLTARFGAGSLTGQVTNMIGTRGNPLRPENAFNVGGRVGIGQNVSIIGDDVDDNLTNAPNDWYADAEGTISVPGATFDVEGNLAGKFRGTNPNRSGGDAIKAIEGSSIDMFAARNGRELGMTLDIYGLN